MKKKMPKGGEMKPMMKPMKRGAMPKMKMMRGGMSKTIKMPRH